MKTVLKYLGIGLCFALLASIRFFETQLFYDPLHYFFKGHYLKDLIPEFKFWPLILSTCFRFCLNTIVSLLIVWLAFKDKSILKFSILLYSLLFLVLIALFSVFLIKIEHIESYLTLFYIRRFLIQPLPIMLLLPAFFYYKKQHK